MQLPGICNHLRRFFNLGQISLFSSKQEPLQTDQERQERDAAWSIGCYQDEYIVQPYEYIYVVLCT